MTYQQAYAYKQVLIEFTEKTERMLRYILYMESMEFLDMLNYCLKQKIKYFYK